MRLLIGLLSHRAPCESSPSGSGPSSVASRAADALGGLARNSHRANQNAIRDAGGIEQLVALLYEQPIGEAATKADQWPTDKRIREVDQSPDGHIWLLEDGADARLLKLAPKK